MAQSHPVDIIRRLPGGLHSGHFLFFTTKIMSMEQLVWAGNQKTGDPRLKLLLLLLADGDHLLSHLSFQSEMNVSETAACLQRLTDMGLAYKAANSDHYYLLIDSFGTPITPPALSKLHELYESEINEYFSIHDIVHHGQGIAEIIKGVEL